MFSWVTGAILEEQTRQSADLLKQGIDNTNMIGNFGTIVGVHESSM